MKLLSALVFLLPVWSAVAQSGGPQEDFRDWWTGSRAAGDVLGIRPALEGRGLKMGVEWKANFLWNVAGGFQQRFGYDDEWRFRATLDLEKLTGWEAIEGLSIYSDLRYRGGSGVNRYVTTGQFAPSTFQGSRLWRFQQVYATYVTPELFGIPEFLTLSGGWQNPTDVFINQPLNKFFLNNTFTPNRGIGANGIGWGGGYAAWGGYFKLKPAEWFYIQQGLYLAVPGANSTGNHGLYFAGAQPPNLNGFFYLSEVGLTPKWGPGRLAGRYATGFMYWGVENKSFFGTPYDQRLLWYWQADQQIYREPYRGEIEGPLGKGATAGKTVKEPKAAGKLNEQGLYFFSLINFAPKYNNPEPFYFQTGLVYKGLIPGRDKDQAGVAIAYANYSYYKQIADEAAGKAAQTYEAVIEFDYRIQINQWAYIQPNLQYIIRPIGTGNVANSTVIGFQTGILF